MLIEEWRVPMVRLFAVTPTIESAGGPPPAKGRERCVEAAAWLVEHPNYPPAFMSRSIGVAESTRRSTLSRLRWWLDVAPDGRPYLPLAYHGTVSLAPEVTSDWSRMQRLVIGGVDLVPHERLIGVLDLVRGPFLGNQTSSSFMWSWADLTARRAHDLIQRVAVRAASQARRGELGQGRLDPRPRPQCPHRTRTPRRPRTHLRSSVSRTPGDAGVRPVEVGSHPPHPRADVPARTGQPPRCSPQIRSIAMNDHTPPESGDLRRRPADLPVVLEELVLEIEAARRHGRSDAALVAEYLVLRERA